VPTLSSTLAFRAWAVPAQKKVPAKTAARTIAVVRNKKSFIFSPFEKNTLPFPSLIQNAVYPQGPVCQSRPLLGSLPPV
jgi:hypothetical protein